MADRDIGTLEDELGVGTVTNVENAFGDFEELGGSVNTGDSPFSGDGARIGTTISFSLKPLLLPGLFMLKPLDVAGGGGLVHPPLLAGRPPAPELVDGRPELLPGRGIKVAQERFLVTGRVSSVMFVVKKGRTK